MPSSGAFWGDIGEWLGINNNFSSAGKERVASQLAFDRSSQFNAQQAEIARNFNSAEAAKNRDFQLQMSNSAVQRRMQDMKEAGINPLLAAGSAASQPAGATASAPAASAGISKAAQGGGLNQNFFEFLSSGTSAVKSITGANSKQQAFNTFIKIIPFLMA